MGNDEQLECEGQVQNLPINIQDHCLQISAYLLPIAAADLMLGT